jgi:hypothetical protein
MPDPIVGDPPLPSAVITTITTAVVPAPPATLWGRFKASFGDSEVILFARLQVLAGVVLGVADSVFLVVSHTDLSPFISNPKTLASVGIVNGIVTELLRRSRATDLSPHEHMDEH